MSISFSNNGITVADITNTGLYSDNTPMIKTPDFDKIVAEANTVTIIAYSLMELITGLFLVDAVHDAGGDITRCVIPYLPGARQDRSNPTGDVLFTAQSVAWMINHRAFDQVIFLDPHSSVMPSILLGAVEYPLELVANRLWHGYGGIIAADKGGRERAERFAAAMNKSHIAYGTKTRDVSNGKITGFGLEGVQEGTHYLVVDDICDGGGTFLGLAEKINEAGAFAHLYVSHGIFKGGSRRLEAAYGSVYTTDSLPKNAENNVFTVPVVADMEKYNV